MIESASYSDIGGRPCNEDSVLIKQDGDALFAVLADGLGGHGHGDLASQSAVRIISSIWHPDCTTQELTDSFQEAHRSILTMQTSQCKMKSTAVVLSTVPGRVRWAHVGDSRLYHFHNGSLVFQTRDHSASQIAVLLGQITPDQIRFHEDRSTIFRALGQEGDLNVDVGEQALSAGSHAFLLCSDGFWEYVLEPEMEETLKQASSPQHWLELMRQIHASRVQEDHDNNTAAAVWLTE